MQVKPDFSQFDKTGRTPRKVQTEALDWIADNWYKTGVFAINGPVGCGKSAIARAVQLVTGAVYMAPENVLVKQASETYPDLNYLIGRKHYMCKKYKKLSCEDIHLSKKAHVCGDCKYLEARQRAAAGEDTMYNPISYYYASMAEGWKRPKVIIIDEVHRFMSTLSLLASEEFGKAYNPPIGMNLIDVVNWMAEQEELFLKLVKLSDFKKSVQYNMKLQKIRRVRNCIIENPEQYMHTYTDEGTLVVYPTTVPKNLRDRILDCDKLILMSASLYKSDISKITDRPYRYIELDSPIPEERRRICIEPGAVKFNWETDPMIVAAWIREKLANYPKQNTIIHVSYSWQERLAPLFPSFLTNTKENKDKVLKRFKKKGGVWLASGCAEGIDLPYDLCTLNLIPILPRANIESLMVRKKLAQPGGKKDYDLSVLRTLQQMAGRGTRAEDDYSKIITADTGLEALVEKYRDELPRSFTETIYRRR